MKRYLLIIIILSLSNFAIAQQESPLNKAAAEKLKSLYNKNDFQAIFQGFSTSMQTAMPLKKQQNFSAG